jgi:hypothetical protein
LILHRIQRLATVRRIIAKPADKASGAMGAGRPERAGGRLLLQMQE